MARLEIFAGCNRSHSVAKGKLIVMMALHYCSTKRDETRMLAGSCVVTYGDAHGTFRWVSTGIRAEGFW